MYRSSIFFCFLLATISLHVFSQREFKMPNGDTTYIVKR